MQVGDMQVGDIVTWKQREGLAEHPTPFHRLGTIVAADSQMRGDTEEITFDVYWWGSERVVPWWESQLEYPSSEWNGQGWGECK